jgi:hypothetical protein
MEDSARIIFDLFQVVNEDLLVFASPFCRKDLVTKNDVLL